MDPGRGPGSPARVHYRPVARAGTRKVTGMKPFGSRALAAVLLAATLISSAAPAQQRNATPKTTGLTVDHIMRGPDLVGYEPTRVVWSRDGRRVYFRWKRAGEPRLKEPDT